MNLVFLVLSIALSCLFNWHDWPFLTYGVSSHTQLKVGTVLSTEAQKNHGLFKSRHEGLYAPIVHYRYSINGKEYRSQQVIESPRSNRFHSEAATSKYRTGENVDVYFPANNPSL